MNDLKLFIINTNDKSIGNWFTYPFDTDEIYKQLKIIDDGYAITGYEAPYKISENLYSIDEYTDWHETYLNMPDYIQRNISYIQNYIESILEINEFYNEGKIFFYDDCKTKYDYAMYTLKNRGDIPSDILEYIDYERYIYDNTINTDLFETPDGVFEIQY